MRPRKRGHHPNESGLGHCRGREHWAAQLRASKVRAMRRLHQRGMCCTCIAALYGLKRQTAYDAITRRTWAHVED